MAAVSSHVEKIVSEFRHLLDDPTSNPVLLAVAIVILSTGMCWFSVVKGM